MSDADDELKDSDLKETENIFEQLMQLLRELFNIQSDKKNEKANTKDDNEVVALDKDDNKEEVGEEKTENTESSDKEGTLDNDLEAALTQIMKAMMLIGGQINALTSKEEKKDEDEVKTQSQDSGKEELGAAEDKSKDDSTLDKISDMIKELVETIKGLIDKVLGKENKDENTKEESLNNDSPIEPDDDEDEDKDEEKTKKNGNENQSETSETPDNELQAALEAIIDGVPSIMAQIQSLREEDKEKNKEEDKDDNEVVLDESEDNDNDNDEDKDKSKGLDGILDKIGDLIKTLVQMIKDLIAKITNKEGEENKNEQQPDNEQENTFSYSQSYSPTSTYSQRSSSKKAVEETVSPAEVETKPTQPAPTAKTPESAASEPQAASEVLQKKEPAEPVTPQTESVEAAPAAVNASPASKSEVDSEKIDIKINALRDITAEKKKCREACLYQKKGSDEAKEAEKTFVEKTKDIKTTAKQEMISLDKGLIDQNLKQDLQEHPENEEDTKLLTKSSENYKNLLDERSHAYKERVNANPERIPGLYPESGAEARKEEIEDQLQNVLQRNQDNLNEEVEKVEFEYFYEKDRALIKETIGKKEAVEIDDPDRKTKISSIDKEFQEKRDGLVNEASSKIAKLQDDFEKIANEKISEAEKDKARIDVDVKTQEQDEAKKDEVAPASEAAEEQDKKEEPSEAKEEEIAATPEVPALKEEEKQQKSEVKEGGIAATPEVPAPKEETKKTAEPKVETTTPTPDGSPSPTDTPLPTPEATSSAGPIPPSPSDAQSSLPATPIPTPKDKNAYIKEDESPKEDAEVMKEVGKTFAKNMEKYPEPTTAVVMTIVEEGPALANLAQAKVLAPVNKGGEMAKAMNDALADVNAPAGPQQPDPVTPQKNHAAENAPSAKELAQAQQNKPENTAGQSPKPSSPRPG